MPRRWLRKRHDGCRKRSHAEIRHRHDLPGTAHQQAVICRPTLCSDADLPWSCDWSYAPPATGGCPSLRCQTPAQCGVTPIIRQSEPDFGLPMNRPPGACAATEPWLVASCLPERTWRERHPRRRRICSPAACSPTGRAEDGCGSKTKEAARLRSFRSSSARVTRTRPSRPKVMPAAVKVNLVPGRDRDIVVSMKMLVDGLGKPS